MNRRKLREQIFKLLFGIEFNDKEEMALQTKLFFEQEENAADEQDTAYITNKCNDIIAHMEEIDKVINQAAEGWTTKRMAKVELTLIRIAVYEIQYDEEVPTNVAINEAVELSKKFGQDVSASFVNGVLARVVKKD